VTVYYGTFYNMAHNPAIAAWCGKSMAHTRRRILQRKWD